MFDEMLKLILSLTKRTPADSVPAELEGLFARLADELPPAEPSAIEDMIWALWTAHDEAPAAAAMNVAITAITSKHYEAAERVLDELVLAYPEWPEAWNKRATLYYILDRDRDSIQDIQRTLLLEPRHFGALCGFAQICLRHDRLDAAASAFEAALRINPHLGDVRALLPKLYRRLRPTMH